jgi:PKD repeat protein
MKNLLLSLIMSLVFIGQAATQTITVHLSGTVTRDSTGIPVSGHQVIIEADSNSYGFNFYTTRITNPNGFYDCTIHDVPATGAAVTFIVKTKNCDSSFLTQSFVGTTTAAIVDFVICNTNVGICEAAFHAEADSSQTGLINFMDTSYPQGQIVSWLWDFGDSASGTGNLSNLQNSVHIFSPSTYNVCLSIVTNLGCTSHRCHTVTVEQTAGCVAHYHYYVDSTNLLNLHFYDISTPANMIASRLWHFGDGGTSTNYDPWHTYGQAGKYNVCIRIMTTDSCVSEFCDSITVGEISHICESWITYATDYLTVHFEGHTHSQFPTTYTWHMGDPASTIVTGINPSFTYPAGGTYTVTLITQDSVGCEYSATKTIYVHATVGIHGTVYTGNSFLDHGFVELIQANAGSIMTVIDTSVVSDSLGIYWFAGILPGHYYVRATLLSTSSLFGQYVPTYHTEAVNWTNANLIELGEPANPYDIHMAHAQNDNSGDGTINGVILQNGKMNLTGTPVSGVEVLLYSSSNELLSFTFTDDQGGFEFSGLAFGSYSVYPEIVGKYTTPTNLTLDNAHSSVTTSFTIQGSNILGIHPGSQGSAAGISEIFPNPSVDKAYINITAVQETEINLSVYFITGQVASVLQYTLERGLNKLIIPVKNLSGGLYYVSIKDNKGVEVIRKMILRKQN